MVCDYTHRHYREVLEYARESAYVFLRYRDYRESLDKQKVIFMRHDLDFGLKNAIAFGRIENDIGICSTYFIRVHAPYNPFSYENYSVIKELQQLGHELALHYAPDFAKVYKEDKISFFLREKEYIEAVLGAKIHGISIHEPARCGFELDESKLREWGLDYHAYLPVFTEQAKYISESAGRWREGCMCQFIKGNTPKLTILTHPVWWFEKTPLENY